MKRFSLLVLALIAFTSAPQSAFAGNYCKYGDCGSSKRWWVEVAGDGNCYVKFQEERELNFVGSGYYTPMFAYIAIARNAACYRTTEWLMNYEYIRRAVR